MARNQICQRVLANRCSHGTGFVQPLQPQDHWPMDFSCVNVAGAFYYLCSIGDGCSRFNVHWEIREAMKAADADRD